ncbi:hypothetical protein AB0E81_16770 [Streptomyces sp. NPDC033538]|uniref:hypothetical protein n=1 Tax=Streptomyces sp. NPDC033538 TaxID=3155367 RepID=UPI0034005183
MTTVLGQLAAVAALLPSLGLLVQQIVTAFNSPDRRHYPEAASPASGPAAGAGRPNRATHRTWLEPVRSRLAASGLTPTNRPTTNQTEVR